MIKLITCDQLRDAFRECIRDKLNKRILIIDIRDEDLYNRSHLCLDDRNDAARRLTRVINIDPSVVRPTTVRRIKEHLSKVSPDDLVAFEKRKIASDVIIIDKDTDDMEKLSKPDSKVMSLIRCLTDFDINAEGGRSAEAIICPIEVLEGGYRAWHEQYKHFTTDPTFDPDADYCRQVPTPQVPKIIQPTAPPPPAMPIQPTISPLQPTTVRHTPISKPVPLPPKPPQPSAPKLDNMSRIGPGTAVPATPTLSVTRPALPRSHSSPNVAQAEDSGDEMDDMSNHVSNINFHHGIQNYHQNVDNLNNNHLIPATTTTTNNSKHSFKPIFDRSLKPSYNIELVNAIKARLNFGNSYEASGRTQTGLQNLGNTCFMNSVIQCLAYTPDLVNYFCSDTYYSHINFNSQHGSKGELAIEFGALIEKVTLRRYKYIEPRSFRLAVRKHLEFFDNNQEDSHEFMIKLFDILHHDLNRHARDKIVKQNGIVSTEASCNNNNGNIKATAEDKLETFWREHLKINKSIISELFEGLFMSTVTCIYCGAQSNNYEVFNCLSLSLTKSACRIGECLTQFSTPERIASWECPSCNQKREAEKKFVIRKLPKILIIHLKRFSLSPDGRWKQKLETLVEFPLQDLILPSTPFRNSYDLYAVVNHYGDLNGGHYTAFCKLESQQWYTFSDRDVSRMESSSVCSQAAYILFYVAK